MQDRTVVADIKALEDRRYDAMLGNDFATLDQLLSEQLVYVFERPARHQGRVSKAGRVRPLARPEEEIRVFGDMPMVVGRMVARVTVGGAERRLDNRSLAIWIRKGGQWRLVAYQPTPVPTAT